MSITLLQPHDGLVGTPFVSYNPASPLSDGLLFHWRSPEDQSFRDFVLEIATDANFGTIVHTIETNGEITELGNSAPDFYAVVGQDLLPKSVYFWRVAHVNAQQEYENYSGLSIFYTTFESPTLAGAVGAAGIVGSKAYVSWSHITDPAVTSIIVKYGTVSGTHPQFMTFPASQTGGVVTGLSNGQTYYFVAAAAGEVSFNYAQELAPSGLEVVAISDNTEVVVGDNNHVVI